MKIANNRVKIKSLLFFTLITMSSCSNDYTNEIAENINLEFELTYKFVVENKPVNIDYSENFSSFKKINKDAFTTIAYTWHKISTDACELNDIYGSESNKSSYERMLNNSSASNLSKTIIDSDRPCLADIYFDNWSNIQNMLILSYPAFKQLTVN